MLNERLNDAVLAWAPAKVNLYLEVLAKRTDGYHELATLMVAVSLYDTLEFKEESSSEIRLDCEHPTLTCGPENLIYRAAVLLQQQTGCRRGAHIRLVKRIPLAAGLAGGSSDAAATLAGLNLLWQLGLSSTELATLGARLGSDVAFFFATPAAWCTGRGEVATPIALGRSLWFVLVCPPFGLSTADVFREVRVPATPETGSELLQAAVAGDVPELGRRMHNRLQEAAVRVCPALAEYQSRLADLRPTGHLMSGSGSTFFALCPDFRDALRIAQGLSHDVEERDSTRPAGPSPIGIIVQSCS